MSLLPDNLQPNTLVAAGTISAAIVSGFFSIVGLVKAKEQSVTQLESTWIESIIDSLAAFLGEVETILRLVEHEEQDPIKGLSKTNLLEFRRRNAQEYQRMNVAYNAVRLRLDSRKADHQQILTDLESLLNAFYSHCHNEDMANIKQLNDVLIQHIQTLSKSVWVRIQEGGDAYKRMLRSLTRIIITSLFAGIVLGGIELWKVSSANTEKAASHTLATQP